MKNSLSKGWGDRTAHISRQCPGLAHIPCRRLRRLGRPSRRPAGKSEERSLTRCREFQRHGGCLRNFYVGWEEMWPYSSWADGFGPRSLLYPANLRRVRLWFGELHTGSHSHWLRDNKRATSQLDPQTFRRRQGLNPTHHRLGDIACRLHIVNGF